MCSLAQCSFKCLCFEQVQFSSVPKSRYKGPCLRPLTEHDLIPYSRETYKLQCAQCFLFLAGRKVFRDKLSVIVTAEAFWLAVLMQRKTPSRFRSYFIEPLETSDSRGVAGTGLAQFCSKVLHGFRLNPVQW